MHNPAEAAPVVGVFTPHVTEPLHAATAFNAALLERLIRATR